VIFNFFYDFLLCFAALIAAPKFLYQRLFYKKYIKNLSQRFGCCFPEIEKKKRKLIWVHAVSVGETKAVSPLVKKLKKEHPDTLVVCSSVTETGHAAAKKEILEADFHVFLPFDFSWVIKPIVARVKPDLLILCETDFWYNFIRFCKAQGGLIVLVNGKMSKRSLNRYKKIGLFTNRLFSLIDLFCLQSTHYKARFLALGISEEKIRITGNMKLDSMPFVMNEEELKRFRKTLGISENAFVFVAGSTHKSEEKLVLDTLKVIWKKNPEVFLILVPRHPERFDEVAVLLERMNLAFCHYSCYNEKVVDCKVVLMDAMGLLNRCYQVADLAFVGGSFVQKVGGHNIIEPSWYGVPVIYGPFMHAQPEFVELMKDYKAGLQVEPEVLAVTFEELLKNRQKRSGLGSAGKKMVSELLGATEKTYSVINRLRNNG